MKISVIGLGYVGTVTAAILADWGHDVVGIDISSEKVASMNRAAPFNNEPGLATILERAISSGKFKANTEFNAARDSDMFLICVGTPTSETGAQDSVQVIDATSRIISIGRNSEKNIPIINRSTCLPTLHKQVQTYISSHTKNYEYVVHPEFLREGSAIEDFQSPPYMVFGAEKCVDTLDIAKSIYGENCSPNVIQTTVLEASLIKYASNAFHATKITFANEIGQLCKELNIDSRVVMSTLCEDTTLNISKAYMRPGLPYGGSCLPKDLEALTYMAQKMNIKMPMIEGNYESNLRQIQTLASRILQYDPKNVAMLGASFKPSINDLRNSPSIEVAKILIKNGVTVFIWDETLEKTDYKNVASLVELSDCFTQDLKSAVDPSDTILLSHKKYLHELSLLETTDSPKIVFDLVGIEGSDTLSFETEGLYWD